MVKRNLLSGLYPALWLVAFNLLAAPTTVAAAETSAQGLAAPSRSEAYQPSLALHSPPAPSVSMPSETIASEILATETIATETIVTEPRWLLVDTHHQTLTLMQGDSVVYRVDNIAIGSNGTGASQDKRTLDQKTPLGDFTITAIRNSSRFHLFLGFDYPTMDYANAAVADGRINQREYEALNQAWREQQPPPQTTGLGGYFGIHGIGAGNPKVHQLFNWTNGCIALTNKQIEDLASMIDVGTKVSIR